jgi:Pyruvate/2-oxoacid:ferredoxin oxidoreductase delta subunit
VTDQCKGCQICRQVCPVPGTITMEGGKITLKKLDPQVWP